MTTTLLLAVLFNGILVIVCGYAFLFGGRPERIGACINFGASGLSTTLAITETVAPRPAEFVTLAIDGVVAACFFWLAVRTTRFWPIWAFGFALAGIVASLAGALLPDIVTFIYQTGLAIYAYLALGALALGTYRMPRDADPIIKDGFRKTWRRTQKQVN